MIRSWGAVIGAGPGLGAALARVMARKGLGVVLAGRDETRLAALAGDVAELVGERDAVTTLAVDVADPAAVHGALTALVDHAEVSCVAYNAAAAGGPLLETAPEQLAASMTVNVLSAVAAVRAVAVSLECSNGCVLLTGGGLALHPSSAAGVLSLGKAALRTAALLLAEELAPRGVRVRTLTIAGTIGSSASLMPEQIAEVFWRTLDGADIEQVYSG